jgi:hypothetical protein
MKRVDEGRLGAMVGNEAVPGSREALRLAQLKPVARPVAGPLEPSRVDEGFRQEHRVPIGRLPVPAQAPQVGGQDARRQVWLPNPGQHQESPVVHHPGQPTGLGAAVPAEVAVSRPIVEHRRAPHEQRHQLVPHLRDVAQRLSRRLDEAKVVVPVQVQPEPKPFLGGNWPYCQFSGRLTLHHSRDGPEKGQELLEVPALVSATALGPTRGQSKPPLLLEPPQEYRARCDGHPPVRAAPLKTPTRLGCHL